MDKFILKPENATLLSMAERGLGELSMLGKIWPLWPEFVRGPLLASAAREETNDKGYKFGLEDIIALGPEPKPNRPTKGLRWATGYCLSQQRMLSLDKGSALIPTLVAELMADIDVPYMARGGKKREVVPGEVIPGAPVWTLAPKWRKAGLPPLLVIGLAMASWEREGPENRRRGICGRVMCAGLAKSFGLPPEAFFLLSSSLEQAAQSNGTKISNLYAELRTSGSWRRWIGYFFKAVEISCHRVGAIGVKAKVLMDEHHELVRHWVRAPKQPLNLVELMVTRPVLGLPDAARELEVTQRTAGLLAQKLIDLGLIHEVTGQKRGRRYAYSPLLDIINEAEE